MTPFDNVLAAIFYILAAIALVVAGIFGLILYAIADARKGKHL